MQTCRPLFHLIILLLVPILLCQISSSALGDDPIPNEPPQRYWKGNLHTHSLWSDGDDFPEMIAEWYRTNGYNFLALSDHNVLSHGKRWMAARSIAERGGPTALEKYEARFGAGWVETRLVRSSEDAATQNENSVPTEGSEDAQTPEPELEVRLKPLDEFRYLVESRGEFIMIPGEEISDRAEGKPVHMNATNLGNVIDPVGGQTVREAMTNNLRAVDEQAQRMGREILMHLNHPNFGWAITAEDLAAVTEERFFEVYNGHPGVNHLGDAERPSVERIWDLANTLRLTVLNARPLAGIATDDCHYYHGRPGSHPGRGWVMVQSRYLTPEHLIRSLRAGTFYASSGVELESVTFDSESRTLNVSVSAAEGASYRIDFIGTRIAGDRQQVPPEEQIGIVLASENANSAVYQMHEDDLFVRAVVTSSQAPADPSFDGQFQQAWTQPVGWERLFRQK